jgi:hypothetical protein
VTGFPEFPDTHPLKNCPSLLILHCHFCIGDSSLISFSKLLRLAKKPLL